MEIKISDRDNKAIVEVRGTLELGSVKRLRDELRKLLSVEKRGVEVDLSAVDYMDSSGAAVLVEGLQWSRKQGVSFELKRISEAVRNSLELMRLLDFFGIPPT